MSKYPWKVGDTVECEGNHDGEYCHPQVPFRFTVALTDRFGQAVDDRGFVHHPMQCKVVVETQPLTDNETRQLAKRVAESTDCLCRFEISGGCLHCMAEEVVSAGLQ